MLNKLTAFVRSQGMLHNGDNVVCAVSGGADSMALLWAMYLLRDKLNIRLSAAHFNHGLRGAESDRDEAFVRQFCTDYNIELTVGRGQVVPSHKGLEAAAREARYAFLRTLPGKIATAHTADDNAETLLLHLVRGTGLRGLGGIMPVNGNVIRPMLTVTRTDVLVFLQEYSIPYVEDSTNAGDDFLRNRLRHRVMPLLKEENPNLSENLTAMALRLRLDEETLSRMAQENKTGSVSALQKMTPAVRSRILADLLTAAGVKEPEAEHISALEKLVFSDKPSAKASFPGGITIARNYASLQTGTEKTPLEATELTCPGQLDFYGFRIICEPNSSDVCHEDDFAVVPKGKIFVRARMTGDSIRLSGGTKTLKKLFIDKKIPSSARDQIPVLADDKGVIGVAGVGANLDRVLSAPGAVRIRIIKT